MKLSHLKHRALELLLIFVLGLPLVTSAQSPMKLYTSEWKKVDSLQQKQGLTRSALQLVDAVYASALKEKNDAQVLKALVYQVMLTESVSEDVEIDAIRRLEKSQASLQQPSRSIVSSLIAEKYWQLFQRNRYRIYNRTATVNFRKDDPNTWSAEDFHAEITKRYKASLADEKSLQRTLLKAYMPIIVQGNVSELRPTLFDLLSNRALEYFRNDERTVTKPAYSFDIDNDIAFGTAAIFAKAKFVTRDTLSPYYTAIQVYQKLLAFHLADKTPNALIDADINRLQFVFDHAVMNDKQSLYEKALTAITEQYGTNPAAAQAAYLLAETHAVKARNYDPLNDTSSRYEWVKAKEICDRIVAQKDSSEGKTNALGLLQEIKKQEIFMETEAVNIPGQPFRARISFRNFTTLYFRIIAVDRKIKIDFQQEDEDKSWQKLVKLPALKTFQQQFPDTKDYQRHAAEIKIDALPIGEYALVASTTPDFAPGKSLISFQSFYVSSISWIRKGNEIFVVDRESGQPIANVSVQTWYTSYDYTARKNVDKKAGVYTSDKNGHFALQEKATPNTNRSLKFELTNGRDRLFTDDLIYNVYRPDQENELPKTNTFLFLDRSIYRPAQAVFFKGIVVIQSSTSRSSTIAAGHKATIILYDANNQKVDSLQLTTSEFGSYSGKFNLPAGLLNGNFRIVDASNQSSTYFNVEEYKRPKFEASIKAPDGNININDSIIVKGSVTAYSGNSVNGAMISYRVVRRAEFPMYGPTSGILRSGNVRGGSRKMIWPPYPQNEIQVAIGKTVSDEAGNFKVVFKALPDPAIDRKLHPIFHYFVTTDITDISGETRSASASVAVGYHSLKLDLDLDQKIHKDSLVNLKINTTNLNDVFTPATVTLKLTRLKSPTRIFREKLWDKTDVQVMDEATYLSLFPHDAYRDEDEPETWAQEAIVVSASDTTAANGRFSLPKADISAGWYRVIATARDKSGDTISSVRNIEVYTEQSAPTKLAVDLKTNKRSIEKGDKLQYSLIGSVDSLYVIVDLETTADSVKRSYVSLNKGKQSFDQSINDSHLGGIGLQTAFVKYNRIITGFVSVDVPYTNKQLSVAVESFRDKTLPGAAEKWKLKISGVKGDKVSAELLTAMYDASLDQFAPHQFNVPAVWPGYYSRSNFEAPTFRSEHSIMWFIEQPVYSFVKIYDQLITDQTAGSGVFIAGGRQREDAYKHIIIRGSASKGILAAPQAQSMADAKISFRKEAAMADEMPPPAPGVSQSDTSVSSNQPSIRKNFNETAFFFPSLHTDSSGNIELAFTMPEALTRWKWMSLAHTKDLAFGYSEKSIVTQKQLMVQPNATRFIRQGDRIDFSGKIVNMTDKEMSGQVELQLIDPTTNQSVDGWFQNVFPNQFFTAPANQSVAVNFSIQIPFQYNKPLTYRMIARSENISDGEEGILPVLTNRILVTESVQLPMRGNATKNFSLPKLLTSGDSETMQSQSLVVEYTSNPAWYAIESLPWLADFPRESADQAFNRYYASAFAQAISKSYPAIADIFSKWKTTDTAALLSNLEKNQELKSVLLAETPWVLQANSESQQKRALAMLFDAGLTKTNEKSSLAKLVALQSPNGGFTWFPGGPDDRYITQYIITGIGHLTRLNPAAASDKELQPMLQKALAYLDGAIRTDYDRLIKITKPGVVPSGIDNLQIQYLYLRSYFTNLPIPGASLKAYNFYRGQSQKLWLTQSRYMQAMIAVSLQRSDDVKTAAAILASLKQNAIVSEEMGMYWKDVKSGYYWHQAPVETQAVMIEAFAEVAKDDKSVSDLKTWLLKQKQTQSWSTTRATADACYALFLSPKAKPGQVMQTLLQNNADVKITLGQTSITIPSTGSETATGYFKKAFTEQQVKASMGNIQVKVDQGSGKEKNLPTWGAVHWQYFENLDLITEATGPLKITKKLFVERNTDNGPVLTPVTSFEALKIGDKIKVRIEISTDRELEYVHLKDMRSAAMEPVNVISSYKWQDGLGYYESTGDAATNFYFSNIRKGTYVFEYPVFITHTGTFTNGIATIQSLFAPEFSAHSEGLKISVE